MKLSLKNIGKIKEAVVEMNGITVIAGENNTGKSTVGKALYSVFNSFYDIERQIQKARKNSIMHVLTQFYYNMEFAANDDEIEEMAKEILGVAEQFKDEKWTEEELKRKVGDILTEHFVANKGHYVDGQFEMRVERICELLLVPRGAIITNLLNNNFEAEFKGPVNNVYSGQVGEIALQIREKTVSILVSKDGVSEVDNSFLLGTETVYIDNPFVLDELASGRRVYLSPYLDHKAQLKRKLNEEKRANIVEEIVHANRFEKIYQMLDSVCGVGMVRGKHSGWGYQEKVGDTVFDFKSVSTGLKTFVILKQLFLNGSLETNGTIILDEPEIHLHPEWQLLFAELIVLLQKEFGMHILLNTHSPYFVRAIEFYAHKYDVLNQCKFYVMRHTEGSDAMCTCVDTTEELGVIYDMLAEPFNKIM